MGRGGGTRSSVTGDAGRGTREGPATLVSMCTLSSFSPQDNLLSSHRDYHTPVTDEETEALHSEVTC